MQRRGTTTTNSSKVKERPPPAHRKQLSIIREDEKLYVKLNKETIELFKKKLSDPEFFAMLKHEVKRVHYELN